MRSRSTISPKRLARSRNFCSSNEQRDASLSSLPSLQAAVKATAIAADDVDEKARFPSEAIELVKEQSPRQQTLAANDPFLSGQGTRTKSADRELKTDLIVRLYDDLDDGMAVVLGKLPLRALRARRSGRQLMTVKSRTACVGFGMERIVLGFIRSHGFEPAMWPTRVRTNLGETE
jgi:hypothetical protein